MKSSGLTAHTKIGENLSPGQKSKFWSKIEIVAKNRNIAQKSVVNNRNPDQKSNILI